MIVSKIMTVDVQTCRLEDSAASAAGKMWNFDIGCLPVVDEHAQVLGMITDRDICIAAYLEGRTLRDINVSTVMSKDVYSCAPNDSISQAEDTMRSHKVHRIPVLDSEEKLVGIISLNDLAREAEREAGTKRRDITPQEVAGTLAALCEPRTEQIAPPTV